MLAAELERIRVHYNAVRLREVIGYVTPDDEHQGRRPTIRAAGADGLTCADTRRWYLDYTVACMHGDFPVHIRIGSPPVQALGRASTGLRRDPPTTAGAIRHAATPTTRRKQPHGHTGHHCEASTGKTRGPQPTRYHDRWRHGGFPSDFPRAPGPLAQLAELRTFNP